MTDAPKRIWAARGLYTVEKDSRWPEPDEYILAAEHERIVAEARNKALEDGFVRAARCRENWCLASPGSDEEFRSFLEGFDAAIRAMKA